MFGPIRIDVAPRTVYVLPLHRDLSLELVALDDGHTWGSWLWAGRHVKIAWVGRA